MKTKISIIAIIVMAFTMIAATPIIKPSQPQTSLKKTSVGFSFIRTHRQGKGAAISWSFTSGNASGFSVQRTYDDPNDAWAFWEPISNTACNGSRSYKSEDNNVYPGYIHYRVIAVLNDGSAIASEVSTLRIVSR